MHFDGKRRLLPCNASRLERPTDLDPADAEKVRPLSSKETRQK